MYHAQHLCVCSCLGDGCFMFICARLWNYGINCYLQIVIICFQTVCELLPCHPPLLFTPPPPPPPPTSLPSFPPTLSLPPSPSLFLSLPPPSLAPSPYPFLLPSLPLPSLFLSLPHSISCPHSLSLPFTLPPSSASLLLYLTSMEYPSTVPSD